MKIRISPAIAEVSPIASQVAAPQVKMRVQSFIILLCWTICNFIVPGLLLRAAGPSTLSLSWEESQSSDVRGYRVYYGLESGVYPTNALFGNVTNVTVPNLISGATYYFAAAAIGENDLESDLSGEVVWMAPLSNSLPSIILTSPTNGIHLVAPAQLSVTALVSSNGHAIQGVRFYDGDTLLGEALRPPYTLVLTNMSAGSHRLAGRAFYDAGKMISSTSASATITNPNPIISFAWPTNNEFLAESIPITLTAGVIGNGHTPDKVEFYNGASLLGEDYTSARQCNWGTPLPGTYKLTAKLFYDTFSTITSAIATIRITAAVPLLAALDASALTWSTSAPSAWVGEASLTHDGKDAAQSNTLNNGQTNWIQTTITGPGTVSFWWKVSSQTNSDYLSFSDDGRQIASLSGEMGWLKRTYKLGTGTHNLRWSYRKDAAGRSGQDTGWIDQVLFSGIPPQVISATGDLAVLEGDPVNWMIQATGTPPLSYQWQRNRTNLVNGNGRSGVTSTNLQLVNARVEDSGAYGILVSNAWGTIAGPISLLSVSPVFSQLESTDVGGPAMVGIATQTQSQQFIVSGSGQFTAARDSFHFVHQQMTGDGGISGLVTLMPAAGPDARAGVMIRESLAADSVFAFIGFSPEGELRWLSRGITGGATITNTVLQTSGSGTRPTWLRLHRNVDLFYGENSTDGTNWNFVTSIAATMASNVYVGMAVWSGSTNTTQTAIFNNVRVTP